MFIKFTGTTPPPTTANPGMPSGGVGGGQGGYGPATPPGWVDTWSQVLFIVNIVLNVFIIFINVWVCITLWRAVKTEYKACFYIIMRTFTIFVAVNALGGLIAMMDRSVCHDSFLKADFWWGLAARLQETDFEQCWWLQAIMLCNMFTCIASSIWLFYAGLNRMMVLVYPDTIINAWGCWIVRITLTALVLIALGLSVLYQKMCGMYTRYDAITNTIQVVASDMAEPLIIGVYAVPLFSLVFYAMAYNNLREKRLLVTSDKTKRIIDTAERKTLKIGMIIMISYTVSLAVHIFLVFVCTNVTYSMLYDKIDAVVSTCPQIALPLALLTCNHRLFIMRKSSSVSTSGTVQDLATKETYSNNSKAPKMSTSSNS
uniref:Uncharacterized protein n=1 Tax=Caenorhabditis japonica TaxID=281687 RepID=A0A8R1DH91_CAEJA